MMQDITKINKKGQLSFMRDFALGFGIAAVVVAVVLKVLSTVNATFTANTGERNATEDAISGLGQFADFFTVIGIVGAAIVVIALLTRVFGNQKQ